MDERMIRCRLNQIRKERGLTLMELSRKSGVAPNSIGALDRDTARRVDLKTIGRLCETLDVEPGDLLVLV